MSGVVANIGPIMVCNDSSVQSPEQLEEALRDTRLQNRPIRLIVSSHAQISTSIAPEVVQVAQFGDVSGTGYEQYPSLCQAVCATMRQAVAGDIVMFAPTTADDNQFRDKQEAGAAFMRLVSYFTSVIGSASPSAVTSDQSHEYACQ